MTMRMTCIVDIQFLSYYSYFISSWFLDGKGFGYIELNSVESITLVGQKVISWAKMLVCMIH